jgi:hypothetical protein
MATVQVTKESVTRWIPWSARGMGLLATAFALLMICGVASDWFLKASLLLCQPALTEPSRWNLCRGYVGAMGGWADEIAASPWPVERTILAGLLIVTILGGLIAWARQRIGGMLLVVGAIAVGALSYVITEHNSVWTMLLTSAR